MLARGLSRGFRPAARALPAMGTQRTFFTGATAPAAAVASSTAFSFKPMHFIASGAAAGAAMFLDSESQKRERERSAVACEGKSDKSPVAQFDVSEFMAKLKVPDWVSAETMKPLGGGVTFGGACGYTAGFATKKIGKALAVGVGCIYVLFQVAATYDYIKINWKKVEKDAMALIDTDGDGKIDEKDIGNWLKKALEILATDEIEGAAAKNSMAGGFATFFLLGFRHG